MASASGNEARWNAFRSQKRSAVYIPPFAPWMVTALQAIKFSIFVALHVFLFGGAAFSKLIVIILATNLNAPSPNALSSKYSQTCPVSVSHTPRVHAAVHVALFLIQALPDLFSVLQCIYRLLSIGRGQGGVNVTLIILECCRGAGLSAIFMLVFPQLDVMRALFLLSCSPLIPMAQRLMVSMMRSLQPDRSLAKRLILTLGTVPHFFLVLLLLSGCYVWSLLDTPFDNVIVLPIAVILASLGFWESWITVGHAGSFFHHLYQVKYGIRKLNAPTRLVIALLRLGIYVCVFSMAAGRSSIEMGHVSTTLTHWNFDLKHTRLLSLALAVCALNIALRGSSHLLAALDLRALPALQPLFIVPPFLLCCFVVLCHISPDCWLAAEIAKFGLSFRCTQWPREPLPVADTYLCCVWLLIGMYKAYQLACNPEFDKCDEVIHSMSPVLNGLCVDQGLIVFHFALSKNDDKRLKLDFNSVFDDGIGKPEGLRSEADRIANVYVCATMWHETENEMRQMFSSILKLDEERAHIMTRRSVASDSTKFRLEAHIFFDDAWEDQAELGRAPNDFFRTFFALVNSMIDGKEDINGSGPTKILVNTAYGGRLVIRLPAGTLLFVHLKDKKMIRHKKRWSQVMYMYYLLGHRIMESHMSVEDKQVIADNTYILAIDGDSKFEPEAFLRLLNLMNTKADIGCACGRIHPIGQGVMVWYQKFEYAIAHWFQKAAEHVFGCVLCAPGCFSLFRAAALMDDNIMHKYTTTAVEPRHYVQYDQGEDRWLSTLLLKQGYRIEYAAASDAETYAPEGFDEFFNQRRRWTPSSVANTIDLLADYKRACANNACISRLYILYQFSVIGFSMLGPAIIFSMLVYAQVAAFHIDMNRIMLYNALPIATFVVVCFTMESNIQLLFAKVLSIIYAFVMLAVIVATCSQVILETMFSPTSMFVVSMIAIFFFAACCHPREFSNIIYGTIFFLMIPATYVVMAFYSLINLNVINWGTREAVAKATGQEQKSESLLDKFVSRVAGSSLSGLLPNRGSKTDPKIEELEKKLLEMEHRLVEDVPEKETAGVSEQKKERDENGDDLFNASGMEVRTGTRDLWMDAEYLQVCEKGRLKAGEQQFWDQLIDTYLKPIQTTPAENRAAADGLRELRNNIAFTVLLLNALMVLAIYLTQNHKDVLAFSWMPHENFKQFRWNSTVQEWTKESIPLKVEMLGLSIIFALFGILLVQTIGLIMHRLNTMVGAFQEVDALGDFVTPAATKRDDDNDIMEIARAMLDTCHYWRGHGSSGYMREASAGSASVLQRLQRARIETAIRNNALRNPK